MRYFCREKLVRYGSIFLSPTVTLSLDTFPSRWIRTRKHRAAIARDNSQDGEKYIGSDNDFAMGKKAARNKGKAITIFEGKLEIAQVRMGRQQQRSAIKSKACAN